MTIVALLGAGAVALGLVLTLVMVVRRLVVRMVERRDARIAAQLRPIAFSLALDTISSPPPLEGRAAIVFTRILGELSVALRGDARERIATVARTAGLVDREIRTLQRSRRAWRRAAAASVLGRIATEAAAGALIGALADPSRDVRGAATLSLGNIRAVQAAPSILAALTTRAVPRAVIVRTILRMGAPALPALRAAAPVGDAQARATCIALIGYLGDASDGRDVLGYLDDPSANVRASAARTLGRLGSRATVGPLLASLNDPAGFVAGAAAEALGRLRARVAIPGLFQLARTSGTSWTSSAAAHALARIDPDATRRAAAAWGASPALHEAADLLDLGATPSDLS